MKVPYNVTGRVRTPSGEQGYIRSNVSARTFGAEVGQSMQRLAAGIDIYAKKLQEQRRFKTLADMSDWQRQTNEEVLRMQEETPDDDEGYFPRVNETMAKREEDFLANVPPELQEEIGLRVKDFGNGVRERQLGVSIEKTQRYSSRRVAEQLDTRKVDVARDPAALEAFRKEQLELINNSGLNAEQKYAAARLSNQELEKVAYRARFQQELTREVNVEDYVATVHGVESSNNPKAENPNSSAAGLGQFIDSTWLEFIRERHDDKLALEPEKIYALKMDPKYAKEATQWYAEKNAQTLRNTGVPVNKGTLYLAHFAGPAGATNIYTAAPETPIEQVMTPAQIAANPFLKGKTAGDVLQWANEKMGMGTEYANLDYDPSFENVPYEDRLNIREDVRREQSESARAQAAQRKALMDQAENELFVGLHDGTLGRADVDRARRAGMLTDYEALKKADTILKDRDKNVTDVQRFQVDYENPTKVWELTSKDDKDSQNAWFKASDTAKMIDENNPVAIVNLATVAQRTGMFAPDAMSKLTAMTRDQDWKRAAYAYDIMTALRETAPQAFNQTVSDADARAVALYDAAKSYMPADALQEMLQPARDPAVQQAREKAKESGYKLAAETYAPEKIFESFRSWGETGETPGLVKSANANDVLAEEFNLLFADAYSVTRDPEMAQEAAMTLLKRNWGFANFGGKNRLMKFPPQEFVKPYNGNYDFMEDQALEAVLAEAPMATVGDINQALTTLQDYQLVADTETENQVLAFRSGRGPSPTYAVTYNKDGVNYIAKNRVRFEWTPQMKDDLVREVELGQKSYELEQARTEIARERYDAFRSGREPNIPEEIMQKEKRLEQEYMDTKQRQLEMDRRKTERKQAPAPSAYGVMGGASNAGQ